MNKLLNRTLMLGVLLTTSAVYAQEGAGSRGGNIRDVNGVYRLNDLVSNAKCFRDVKGSEVIETRAGLRQILASLSKLDWYFANDLETQIAKLHICFTGKLYFIPPVDANTPVNQKEVAQYLELKQLGIRVNDDIYVDQNKYLSQKLTDFDRDMFWVHEAAHAYLPDVGTEQDDGMRTFHLYTIVSAIADVAQGKITDREDLHYTLSNHNALINLTVTDLDPFRAQVEYALGTQKKRRQMILESDAPEILVSKDEIDLNFYLNEWNQIHDHLDSRLKADIADILVKGTNQEFESILSKRYERIRIGEEMLTVLSDLSGYKQERFFASQNFMDLAGRSAQWLNSVVPVFENYRIRAGADLQSLGTQSVQRENITLLNIQAGASGELPDELKRLANTVVVLIKSNKMDEVVRLLTNSEFKDGLALKAAQEAIDQMNTGWEDPVIAKEKVREIASGVRVRLLNVLQGKLLPQEFEKVEMLINQ